MSILEIELQQYSRCVEGIYKSALNPVSWCETLKSMQSYIGAENVTMAMMSVGSHDIGFIKGSRLTDDDYANYMNNFSSKDVWMNEAAKKPAHQVLMSQDLIANRKFVGTQYYEEWVRPLGLFYCMGGFFQRCGNEVGMLSVQIPYSKDLFAQTQKRKMEAIFRHMNQAYRISSDIFGLEEHKRLSLSLLESLNIGVAVLNERGVVRFTNQVLNRWVNQRMIHLQAGQISFPYPLQNRTFQQAIGKMRTQMRSPCVTGVRAVIERKAQLPLTILLTPVSDDLLVQRLEQKECCFFCFIRDPLSMGDQMQLLRNLGLTPSESLVAVPALKGVKVKAISDDLKLSPETTRSHLKQVYQKLAVHSQNELVVRYQHLVH